MANLNLSISLLGVIAILVVVTTIGGSIVLLRRSSDKALITLSVIACVAALVFVPLVRISPEQSGIFVFLMGVLPVLVTIIAAVVASTARLMQTHRWESLPSLVLSVAAAGSYFYPDVMVTCSAADQASALVKTEPKLVIEVLSPWTMGFDRFRKLEEYKTVPSIQVILIVDTEKPQVVVHRRGPSGWSFEAIEGLAATIHLPEINADLPMTELYDGVG